MSEPKAKRRHVTAIGLALVLGACTREKAEPAPTPTAKPASGPVPPPTDHLAPGELIEGRESLIGLKVPRDLAVRMSTNTRGVAEGNVKPELVANYVRAHVRDGKMTAGASGTVFEGVRVPASPDRPLRVTITGSRGTCRMEVWDVTPTPATKPDPGNDAERWRQAGFNSNGTPLDPMHMQ